MGAFAQWGPIAIMALAAIVVAAIWDIRRLRKAHDRIVETLHSMETYRKAMLQKRREDQ